MMHELIHSDAWFRVKAPPYYLSPIKKNGRYWSSWYSLPRLDVGIQIVPLRVKYPQRFLLKIRKIYYHYLIQWVQQFTHAALVNFISGAQFTTVKVHLVRCFRSIRTWMCNVSNSNFYKGGFCIVN